MSYNSSKTNQTVTTNQIRLQRTHTIHTTHQRTALRIHQRTHQRIVQRILMTSLLTAQTAIS